MSFTKLISEADLFVLLRFRLLEGVVEPLLDVKVVAGERLQVLEQEKGQIKRWESSRIYWGSICFTYHDGRKVEKQRVTFAEFL